MVYCVLKRKQNDFASVLGVSCCVVASHGVSHHWRSTVVGCRRVWLTSSFRFVKACLCRCSAKRRGREARAAETRCSRPLDFRQQAVTSQDMTTSQPVSSSPCSPSSITQNTRSLPPAPTSGDHCTLSLLTAPLHSSHSFLLCDRHQLT